VDRARGSTSRFGCLIEGGFGRATSLHPLDPSTGLTTTGIRTQQLDPHQGDQP
jgi:hypothetical protein